MNKKQFLSVHTNSDSTAQNNFTALSTANTISSNTNYLTGYNTNYVISIPDSEITFEELNRTMNTLSNAVVHMQKKIAAMESVENPKCKPRKLDI